MIDADFMKQVQELHAKGDAGKPELRELLKNGNLARLIMLAARGVRARPKRNLAKPENKSRIPDEFPGEAEKQAAVLYWQQHRRPDLVAAIEDEAEKFHDHHYSHGKAMLSWPYAWRTWYKNALQFNAPPREGQLFAVPVFEQTHVAGWETRLGMFYSDGTWLAKWGGKPPVAPSDPIPADCKCPKQAFTLYLSNRERRA